MENKRFWAKNIRSEILRGKCTVIIRKYISAGRLFQAEDRIFQVVVTVYYMDDTGETYEDIEYFAFVWKYFLNPSQINVIELFDIMRLLRDNKISHFWLSIPGFIFLRYPDIRISLGDLSDRQVSDIC